ncbi:MAG: DUF4428 domain-containing protein [Eubacterium sp.]|nr:DUF4428 domain-containing protein [Eubacterium sp.]
MGLFDKKFCDVCGEKIKLLGNRKLEDGNLCKSCASKLSPWFSERRHSTVASIKEQLAYREANKEKVERFHSTKTIGDRTKVYLDEAAKNFMVTSAGNIREANPDVLAFEDVTGCHLDIDEDKYEEKFKDDEGNEKSYNPPRYRYEYDFTIIINVNNPYFDDIRFRLNSSSVEGDSRVEYDKYKDMGEEIVAALTNIHEEVREQTISANEPKKTIVCPFCGATGIPTAAGTCEYCGASL